MVASEMQLLSQRDNSKSGVDVQVLHQYIERFTATFGLEDSL